MADEYLGGGNRRPIQLRKVRSDGWTEQARATFLAVLAETCNVQRALAASGKTHRAAYRLRQREPAFAALWREALATGYERLEAALLRHALASVEGAETARAEGGAGVACTGIGGVSEAEIEAAAGIVPGAGLHPAKLTVTEAQLALAILNRYRASLDGRRAVPRGVRRRTPEETDAMLRQQLDRLARQYAANDPPPPDDEGAGAGGKA